MSHEDRKGVLERSLANLTIGVAQSVKGRAAALRDTFTGEWDQQLQVPLSGIAQPAWAFTDAPLAFDIPLMPALSQRLVEFKTPHFTHGIELTRDNGVYVDIRVQLKNWQVNEFGWTVGAIVRFAVQCAMANTPYAALAHLNFQGYGCIPEQDEFQN